jgi:hypothetical protein
MGTGISGLFSGTYGGGCFTAGTCVLTASGHKPIEHIRCGDYVYAKNMDTGEKGLKRVIGTFVHLKDSLIRVELDGIAIKTTDIHPFWVEHAGWTCANNLVQGNSLELYSGDKQEITSLTFTVTSGSGFEVYNIEVEEWHTYYVSDLDVLVHNKATGPFKKPTSGTGKEKSNDIPSWAEGERPYVGENGRDFAKRLLDERYGAGNYKKRGSGEYSQLKKWGDRGFE